MLNPEHDQKESQRQRWHFYDVYFERTLREPPLNYRYSRLRRLSLTLTLTIYIYILYFIRAYDLVIIISCNLVVGSCCSASGIVGAAGYSS